MPGRENAIGLALIIGAVVIGLLLLVKGYDAEDGLVATEAAPVTSTTTTTQPEGTVDTPTTTTLPTSPPAQVVVKVANASGASGVAAKTRDTLQGRGYTQISLGDAPSVVATSQVLFTEGAEGDAQAVAGALGLTASAVAPVPSPAPVKLGDAKVLVLAGPDLV